MNGTIEDLLAWRNFADEDFHAARVLSTSDDAEALAQ